MHALTDAILGALGEGDIGSHFPPSDPKWKGASSSIFLNKAIDLLSSRNGIIANVDITILAEAPRIGPHIDEMKALLSPLLHVSKDRIAIKATTTEQLGAREPQPFWTNAGCAVSRLRRRKAAPAAWWLHCLPRLPDHPMFLIADL
jgi:2-C-methyl-D-erythritol 2,4-cyclodiphosphate synthase